MPPPKRELAIKRYGECKIMQEIAEDYGTTNMVVAEWFSRYGFPKLTPAEHGELRKWRYRASGKYTSKTNIIRNARRKLDEWWEGIADRHGYGWAREARA